MASVTAIPSPPLRTARGERTAERILDAAEALFAEQGFAGTTMRDVARTVGIRTPSLYNHFESKEDLHAAVLERGIRPVLELLAAFVGAGDTEGRQRVLLEQVVQRLGARPNLLRLVQFETLTGGTRLAPALRDWLATAFERAAALVADEPSARPWPEEHIPLLVLAMYHVVIGYFTIAPFYQDLSGEDLTAPEALERQTSFLHEVVSRLLPDDPRAKDTLP
jgi:AcrR family transcriptional regulator